MNLAYCRAPSAAVAIVCALTLTACSSSSPVEPSAEAAGKASTLEVLPTRVDLGSSATTATLTVKNTFKKTLSWTASETASWLSLGSRSGTISNGGWEKLALSVQRSGLTAGKYQAEVLVTAQRGADAEIAVVSMTVESSGASSGRLSASPLAVDFGGSATTASVTLKNDGDRSVNWTAAESAGWLKLGAVSGTIAARSTKTVSMSVSRSNRSPGTYETLVKFDAGAAGAVNVTASMTVEGASGTVMLAGQLVDQFDGHALAGITVEYNGSSTRTDGSGRFTIPGSPTSTLQQLTLLGTGVYRRVTFARTGDSKWRVVPSSFDMTAFDDLARDEFGDATVRWASPPTIYVDSRPEGFSSPDLATWTAEVKVQAAEFISKWTAATISPASVIVTSSPPQDFTPGTIVIHFSENGSDYGNTNSIGYARLAWNSDRSIRGAGIWLRYLGYADNASKRKGILGHELGHAMGLGHMNGSTPSFMSPSLGSKTDLSAFDGLAGELLYTRSSANQSPDTDSSSSYRGLLVPSGLPEITEWICGAGEEMPGR